jgi:hypothetical protein
LRCAFTSKRSNPAFHSEIAVHTSDAHNNRPINGLHCYPLSSGFLFCLTEWGGHAIAISTGGRGNRGGELLNDPARYDQRQDCQDPCEQYAQQVVAASGQVSKLCRDSLSHPHGQNMSLVQRREGYEKDVRCQSCSSPWAFSRSWGSLPCPRSR